MSTSALRSHMENANVLTRLTDQPALDSVAEPLSRAVHGAYESAGEAGRVAKNAMHGVWLGHPLHPALVAVPIGAWTTAVALDVAADVNHDRGMARAADFAIAVGLAGAVVPAITGLTDWSETSGSARRTGLVHGLLNVVATGLFAASYLLAIRDRAALDRRVPRPALASRPPPAISAARWYSITASASITPTPTCRRTSRPRWTARRSPTGPWPALMPRQPTC